MHVPDHFLDPAVTTTTAAVALIGVSAAAWQVRQTAPAHRLAFAAAVTGFVFAAQMVNYAVLPGTSGHFLGAALAAALLGPWLGLLCVTVVLAVQALVFADGGLTALGTNVTLMAVVGVAVACAAGAVPARLLGRPAPRTAAGLGAALSVPAAALVFSGLYAVGGTVPVATGGMAASMLGVHALIGVGEAVITVAVLSLVLAVAPGLAAVDARPSAPAGARRGALGVAGAGLLCAAVLSAVASSAPDGLEAVALAYSFADAAAPHAFADAALAGYGEPAGLPLALAGVLGLVLTGVLAAGALRALTAGRPVPARI
ncbi:energy-coupling factor ABC transporter permease [Kocuria sabuli]|uniref:energy-coupling factor ABC transporter permease n=1 Tax=Kocuria sabuli TaxID=3071448 RepID=UPI0034D5109B